MRDMLAHADLGRHAGQFVWLELNFDKAENRQFLDTYGAVGTPTFYVIDARTGQVAATQQGAMSYTELVAFLGRGASVVLAKGRLPADAALTRGDALLAQKPDEAVAAYREALRLAPAGWGRHDLAEASLVSALQSSGRFQQCAQRSATEASRMKRGPIFARTVVSGMWCLVSGDSASWIKEIAPKLQPLAEEALALRSTVRDHRDEIYRTFMMLALLRDDKATAAKWGDRWLAELDAIKPASDEERLALDIARVENIGVFGDTKRILPALLDSERALPDNWNASLRVAQMESQAKDYEASIGACDRGLARTPGPLGRSWLLQTKADALNGKGQAAEARRALDEALQAAQGIPLERTRENNVKRISNALESISTKKPK